jgi:hypothetical protein
MTSLIGGDRGPDLADRRSLSARWQRACESRLQPSMFPLPQYRDSSPSVSHRVEGSVWMLRNILCRSTLGISTPARTARVPRSCAVSKHQAFSTGIYFRTDDEESGKGADSKLTLEHLLKVIAESSPEPGASVEEKRSEKASTEALPSLQAEDDGYRRITISKRPQPSKTFRKTLSDSLKVQDGNVYRPIAGSKRLQPSGFARATSPDAARRQFRCQRLEKRYPVQRQELSALKAAGATSSFNLSPSSEWNMNFPWRLTRLETILDYRFLDQSWARCALSLGAVSVPGFGVIHGTRQKLALIGDKALGLVYWDEQFPDPIAESKLLFRCQASLSRY